jgi:hypothetical protein
MKYHSGGEITSPFGWPNLRKWPNNLRHYGILSHLGDHLEGAVPHNVDDADRPIRLMHFKVSG